MSLCPIQVKTRAWKLSMLLERPKITLKESLYVVELNLIGLVTLNVCHDLFWFAMTELWLKN